MRGTRQSARFVVLSTIALASLVLSGCQSPSPRRVAASEPGLSVPGEVGSTPVVEAPVAPSKSSLTFVDRHPLFSKPRDFYESSGNNKVVKTAAAAVIGVPAGIVGELKQIVVGTPNEPKY